MLDKTSNLHRKAHHSLSFGTVYDQSSPGDNIHAQDKFYLPVLHWAPKHSEISDPQPSGDQYINDVYRHFSVSRSRNQHSRVYRLQAHLPRHFFGNNRVCGSGIQNRVSDPADDLFP